MVEVMLGACFGGRNTARWGVEMGLCTHLEFQDRYVQLRTLGFGYVLSMHVGMSGRPFPRTSEQRRVLGTSDQMTPPHTHTRTLRCTARSSTRSWLDCRAPTSIIHLPTNNIVSNSFLTVLRAEPAFFRYGDEAHDGAGAAGSSDCRIIGTLRPPRNSAKGDPEALGPPA